jgi:lipopolysaccharide transport system permease protein
VLVSPFPATSAALGMTRSFQEILASVRLWRVWLRLGAQDVRARFRRSIFGVGWIFLNLTITLLAVGYVYGHLLGQDLHEFIPYLTIGLVVWGYLTASLVDGGIAFIASEGYIKQISLPIYVYLFRSFVSIGLTTLINLATFFVVAILYGVRPGPGVVWAIPGIAILMAASLFFITIAAHLNARFRDVSQIAAIGMQVGFYVTPVLFPAALLRQRGIDAIIDFNPMFHLLEVVRQPLLRGLPAPAPSYVACALLLAMLAAASAAVVAYFQRRIVFSL